MEVDEPLELIAAEALNDFMRRTRHSTRTLANATGVNRGKITRLRCGKQKTLAAPDARRIEQVIGLPENTLFLAPEITRYLRVREGSGYPRRDAA